MSPSPLLAAALFGGLTLSGLTGCSLLDPTETDPNIARIHAVSLDAAPAEGGALFVRLATRFDTTDTEAASGPFPLTLATSEVGVVTTDGRHYDGEALAVEVRRCAATCASSESLGRTTVEPGAWSGSERAVTVGGASVTLTYRKTSS